ncbi:hypothetical protein ACHAXT_011879 [Thalassiosira profunda]
MVYATDEGNLHLDHALNVSVPALPPSIERALTKALKSFERACSDASRSLTILGYAAAAYIVMAGMSRLMEARYKRLPPPSPGNDDLGSCKRNAKRSGKSLDVTEEWDETEEWEREIANNPGLLDGIP